MSELKPGPCFDCGEIDSCVDGLHNDRWVRCLVCGSEGPQRPTEAEAIAAWNVLSAAPSLLVACEAALNYIDDCKKGESRLHACSVLESAIRKARGGSDD